MTHINAKEAGHPMQIVLISRQLEDLWNGRRLGPVHAELLCQLLEVQSCCLANCIH